MSGKVERIPSTKTSRLPARSPIDNLTLGERIRMLRTQHGWTGADLAEAAGMSASFIVHLELGKTGFPRSDTLYCVAWALGVSMEYLLIGQRVDEEEFLYVVDPLKLETETDDA